jgi:protein-S-isoprenylcysteine O-methyltransferase Ste14
VTARKSTNVAFVSAAEPNRFEGQSNIAADDSFSRKIRDMTQTIIRVIQILWIAMFAIWVLAGFTLKQTEQSRSEGMSRIAVYVVWGGWWLLFGHGFGIDPLSRRLLEPAMTTVCIGLAITATGLAFAVLARLYLGDNWSALTEVKEGHELIRIGPYAIVRHPIYSGLMLATLGTAVAYGEVSGFVGFFMVVAAWSYKSRLEESAMVEQFGAQYETYQAKVKGLLPFLW